MTALVITMASLLLTGCRQNVLYTTHQQVLVERSGNAYIQLADGDPRYAVFEAALAVDPGLTRLLTAYEHATAAFIASGTRSGASSAVVNHAVLVLGAPTGLLRNTNIQGLYGDVRLDLAFGLAIADPAHLAEVAPSLARMIGEALMVLAGQGYPEGACTKLTCDAEAASRSSALTRGLGAALEAVYIESASRAGAGAPDAYAAAQQRAEWLAANAYGQRLSEGAFSGEPVAAREIATCPGVAGALFYRLMARSTSGYPQRYMLWFANTAAGDEALGKIVLAATRLGRRATVTGFAQAYATAFPRERDLVIGLLAELQLEGTP